MKKINTKIVGLSMLLIYLQLTGGLTLSKVISPGGIAPGSGAGDGTGG